MKTVQTHTAQGRKAKERNRRKPVPFHLIRGLMVLCCCLLSACGVHKHLAPDERLLNKNKYEVTMADGSPVPTEVNEALSGKERYVLQSPNARFLGVRWGLRIYCLSSPHRQNFLNKYLQKQGTAPVVYNEDAATKSAQQIQSLLYSKGCFKASVSFDTVNVGKHKVDVNYHITATPRKQIEEIEYTCETQEVKPLIEQWRADSYLKVGDYYDQEALSKERDRLAENLQNEGYYLAKKELITFDVDTTYDPIQVGVNVNIHDPKVYDNATKQTYPQKLQKYYIAHTYIYPNSSAEQKAEDTTVVPLQMNNHSSNYIFVHHGEMTVSPHTICNNLVLFDGMRYRPRAISLTYNSLRNLQNFKYISIETTPSAQSSDSLRLLDAHIKLINNYRRKISASLEVNNASSFMSGENVLRSGNLGLETSIEYQNKNLFGNAELFKIGVSQLVELPKFVLSGDNEDREFHDIFQTFVSGIDLSLDIPKFILPFKKDFFLRYIRPHTVFKLGGNYQYRSYFERLLVNTSYGYSWTQNRTTSHQLLPLELTYVRFFNIEQAFLNRIANLNDARIQYLYSNHFIMNLRYEYLYNTQQFNTRNDFSYFHLSLESAGNLLRGISVMSGIPQDSNGVRNIFGVPFSQYLRMNSEFKHYFYIGADQTFVARLLVGLGVPYGNSSAMPYEKGFFGGGPNTIRAWQLRHLGPGLYHTDSEEVFERVGDMTIVMNLEHRFPIAKRFEGAVFADIGNVWMYNKSNEFANGEISFHNFFKGLAVGTGVGLRFNISIVTLRLDMAIPLYDPGYDEGSRWRLPHWKLNQIVTNFGIDYPF